MLAERPDVTRVAGEHDRVRPDAGKSHHNRVRGRDRRCAAGPGPQPGSLARAHLGHVTDLARPQQPVGVEIAAMVSGQRLGERDSGDLSRPGPAAAQLGEPAASLARRSSSSAIATAASPDTFAAASRAWQSSSSGMAVRICDATWNAMSSLLRHDPPHLGDEPPLEELELGVFGLIHALFSCRMPACGELPRNEEAADQEARSQGGVVIPLPVASDYRPGGKRAQG